MVSFGGIQARALGPARGLLVVVEEVHGHEQEGHDQEGSFQEPEQTAGEPIERDDGESPDPLPEHVAEERP